MSPPDTSLRRSVSEVANPVNGTTRVMLVLVATDGAAWLPSTIAAVKAQTYEDVDVIAVDNACQDNSRAILDKAFGKQNVVTLKRRSGYARALANGLKAAGDRATSAKAFLFVHDDCAMDPDCLARLIETLEYDDVGVAGPKLVDWSNPELLQEAGLSIDRFGRAFNPLELGELDQGQHDRVRETMWVSSACMLISRDVVERVGFFDNRYVVLGEDLDFCWRARVSGFKVAFCGEARARHAAASMRDERKGYLRGHALYFSERNLLASVLKNYSAAHAIILWPVSLAIAVANALAKFVVGKRSEAAQIVEAVRWNLSHVPGTLRARHRVQKARRIPDTEVMRNATRGANRLRAIAERGFERIAGDPASGVEEAEGLATPGEHARKRLRDRIRAHPLASATIVLTALYLIGSRTLYRAGGVAGADMPPFPAGPSDFFKSFFSGWRSTGLGSAGSAPTAHFLSGLMSLVTFGRPGLAQRLFIMLLIPLAGANAARFAARLGCGVAARRVAAFAYALSPLALWALGEGRLSDLVLVAAAPGLCVPLVRASGLAEGNGWKGVLIPTLGCAFAAAFSPWSIGFVALAGVSFALACLLGGRRERVTEVLLTAGVIAAGALLLLFPWSMELFRHGSAFGIGGGLGPVKMENLLRLSPAPFHPVPIVLAGAFPLAAVAGFLVCVRAQDMAARALAVCCGAGLGVAWAVERGVPALAPRASLPLCFFAACSCALIGLGAERALPALRGRQFGTSQIGITVVVLALLTGGGAGGFWLVKGTRPGIRVSGSLTPASMEPDRQHLGEFRLLWVAGSLANVRVSVAPPAGNTMISYGDPDVGLGHKALDKVVAGIARGTIDAAGRQLAVFGVRFVFLRTTDGKLLNAFLRQSDLRFWQRFEGSTVLANTAWLPNASAVSGSSFVLASQSSFDLAPAAIAAADPISTRNPGFKAQSSDVLSGSIPQSAKKVLLAESFDARWTLTANHSKQHASAQRSFGWANAFAIPGSGPATLAWSGQGIYRILLFLQLNLLIGLALAVSRKVAAERGER